MVRKGCWNVLVWNLQDQTEPQQEPWAPVKKSWQLSIPSERTKAQDDCTVQHNIIYNVHIFTFIIYPSINLLKQPGTVKISSSLCFGKQVESVNCWTCQFQRWLFFHCATVSPAKEALNQDRIFALFLQLFSFCFFVELVEQTRWTPNPRWAESPQKDCQRLLT